MAAQLIDHLKKPDMAKEAERLLADSGWLPEPLRSEPVERDGGPAATDDEVEALPAFLADEGPESPVDDEPAAVAAE
jgi:ParB family chromosome partitioning protein